MIFPSRTSSALSLLFACALMALLSACSSSSGSSPSSSAGGGTSSAGESGDANLNDGGETTSGSDVSSSGSEGSGDGDPIPGATVDGSDVLFSDVALGGLDPLALTLRTAVLDDAAATLSGLNQQISSGTVDSPQAMCFEESYPVLSYFCLDSEPVPITDFGATVYSFFYADEDSCRAALFEDFATAPCTAEFLELVYGGVNVVYSARTIAGETAEELRLFEGEPGSEDSAEAICEVTISGGSTIVYSEAEPCDELIRPAVGARLLDEPIAAHR